MYAKQSVSVYQYNHLIRFGSSDFNFESLIEIMKSVEAHLPYLQN